MKIPSGNPIYKRVLIVEDNDINLNLFKTLMKEQGHETLLAKEGKEALKLAQDELPDLILMDDQLPDVSGLEVLRRLRDDERTKKISIIAVFGFCDERAALDAGCDVYVSKPIKPRSFLEMIESFLSKCDHQDDERRSG